MSSPGSKTDYHRITDLLSCILTLAKYYSGPDTDTNAVYGLPGCHTAASPAPSPGREPQKSASSVRAETGANSTNAAANSANRCDRCKARKSKCIETPFGPCQRCQQSSLSCRFER